MSAAVASPTLCGCGCGNAVDRRRFLNQTHKERFEASQTYPKYLSAELRIEKCLKHGQEYEQTRMQFSDGGAARTGIMGVYGAAPVRFSPAAPAIWNGSCPECKREDAERAARKTSPQVSACEARACGCLAPECPECGKPMQMGPGSLGWHLWVCNDLALVEDNKAETGIIAKPLLLVGSHRRETWTPWRNA